MSGEGRSAYAERGLKLEVPVVTMAVPASRSAYAERGLKWTKRRTKETPAYVALHTRSVD